MRTALPTFAFLATSAIPAIVHANSVVYACGSNPQVTVNDSGSADLDPAPNALLVNFACSHVDDGTGNEWSATGKIRAAYFKNAPKSAELEIYDARWVSEGPALVSDDFVVRHNFPLIGGAETSASVSGDMFHNGGDEIIEAVDLDPHIDIIGPLGNFQFVGDLGGFAAALMLGPIAFFDSFGPVAHVDPIGQRVRIPFYLGETNDAWQFYTTPNGLFVATEQ